MPLYSYTEMNADGEIDVFGNTITKYFRMSEELPREIVHEGIHYLRDVGADHCGRRPTASQWPVYSQSLGVQPFNAKKFEEHSIKAGVPTEFKVVDATGIAKPVFTSQEHQNKYCKMRGWRNHDRY